MRWLVRNVALAATMAVLQYAVREVMRRRHRSHSAAAH
ncbi:hypothetical protein J2S68_000460 [Glycomyces algeriensis]|jgi:hypothetical protein|nr:hypothetical protein [Glycomyces algeriensis]